MGVNAEAFPTDDQHAANVWRWLIANGCTDVVVLGAPIEIRDGLIHYWAYQTEGDQVVVHRGRPVVRRNAIPLTVPWRD